LQIENDFQINRAVLLRTVSMSSLAEIPLGVSATVRGIGGSAAFRRRLLEMGLVPGTRVKVVTVAPLGDPLQIEVRGGQWSIRRAEAAVIEVAR
jgi:ferrous iron transport protein A